MNENELPEEQAREIAEETLVGDLVAATVDELRAAPAAWQSLSEMKQAEVIERITSRVIENVGQAIRILASCSRPTISATLDQVTFKGDVKAVIRLNKKDPAVLDLAEATGEDVLIVLPHLEQFVEQGVDLRPEPDQRALDIPNPGADEDPLLHEATALVVRERKCSISMIQRALKIGYNRASTLVERLEDLSIVSPMNYAGVREVYLQSPPSAENLPEKPEEGEQVGGFDRETGEVFQTGPEEYLEEEPEEKPKRSRKKKPALESVPRGTSTSDHGDLVEEARLLVRKLGMCSAALLQEKLGVGKVEAGEIISALIALDVVSDANNLGQHAVRG